MTLQNSQNRTRTVRVLASALLRPSASFFRSREGRTGPPVRRTSTDSLAPHDRSQPGVTGRPEESSPAWRHYRWPALTSRTAAESLRRARAVARKKERARWRCAPKGQGGWGGVGRCCKRVYTGTSRTPIRIHESHTGGPYGGARPARQPRYSLQAC